MYKIAFVMLAAFALIAAADTCDDWGIGVDSMRIDKGFYVAPQPQSLTCTTGSVTVAEVSSDGKAIKVFVNDGWIEFRSNGDSGIDSIAVGGDCDSGLYRKFDNVKACVCGVDISGWEMSTEVLKQFITD